MKTTWPEIPIGDFLTPSRKSIQIEDGKEYNQITVALHGRGVRLRQTVLGKAIKTKHQYEARAGRFIYSRIDARNGAMGIVPAELDGAAISGDFPTFDFDLRKVEPRFFEYLSKTASFEKRCLAPSKGVTNRKRLKEAELLAFRVPLPPLPEQRRIVAKIDQIAARAEEATRLAGQIEEEQTALLLRRVEELSKYAPRAPMAEVAPVVRRQVDIQPAEWYPELGIRSFGKGTFHKDPVKGSEVGTKRLYRIEPGDLLFSNVFSWEGAIAVVQPADKDRFGSHRFITCVPNPKRATAQFLCYWFLSDEGLADIRAASPGAAGRNKTLGIKKLEAIQVPVPPIDQQRDFSKLLKQIRRAKSIHMHTATSLEAIMPALLDHAFRGEL
jgi:type I restriction enzyme S subunit